MMAEGRVYVDKVDYGAYDKKDEEHYKNEKHHRNDSEHHSKNCMCSECKERRMEHKKYYSNYMNLAEDEFVLGEIKEKVHKNKKMLKDIKEDVEDIKHCQKSIKKYQKDFNEAVEDGIEILSLNMEGDKMMYDGMISGLGGCGGGCNNNGNGWGDWGGILIGLLFGAMFGWGNNGFGGMGRNGVGDGMGAMGTLPIGQNLDTASILNAIAESGRSVAGQLNTDSDQLLQSTGSLAKDIAQARGDLNANLCSVGGNLATQVQNQTNAIQSDIFNQTLHTDGELMDINRSMLNCCCETQQNIGTATNSIMNAVNRNGYDNTVATLQTGYDTRSAICASDRNTDAGFFGVANQLCGLGKENMQQTNILEKDIFANQYQTSRQLDAMAAQNAQCCCENKLLTTMGFSDLQNNMDKQFCELKAMMAGDKIRELEIQNSQIRDALNQKSLADAINTTITNGLTQLGAVYCSNTIPSVQSAAVR